MSFRDFGGGDGSGHAARQQPKQRRNEEESSFERGIRANIREMQECVRGADDQVEHARKGLPGRGPRGRDSAEAMLDRAQELARSTEQLFRDWTVHLAGEPFERQRKKLSFEKLRSAFDDESSLLRDVARRQEAAPPEFRSLQGGARSGHAATAHDLDPESPLCDSPRGSDEDSLRAQIAEEAALRSRVAQEREEGIRRIQGQVAEVNHIFRDLASMVSDQGIKFETIEEQANAASLSIKDAGEELKKAAERQKNARERLCWLLAGVALLVCLLVLPSLPSFRSPGSLLEGTTATEDKAPEVPRAPVVPERYRHIAGGGADSARMMGLELPEGAVVVHETGRLAR